MTSGVQVETSWSSDDGSIRTRVFPSRIALTSSQPVVLSKLNPVACCLRVRAVVGGTPVSQCKVVAPPRARRCCCCRGGRQRVDVAVLDCKGHELHALCGAMKLLMRVSGAAAACGGMRRLCDACSRATVCSFFSLNSRPTLCTGSAIVTSSSSLCFQAQCSHPYRSILGMSNPGTAMYTS